MANSRTIEVILDNAGMLSLRLGGELGWACTYDASEASIADAVEQIRAWIGGADLCYYYGDDIDTHGFFAEYFANRLPLSCTYTTTSSYLSEDRGYTESTFARLLRKAGIKF